jgi:hypothetical protein
MEPPGDAPAVLARDRLAPGEILAGAVEIGDPPFGVGEVDRHRHVGDQRLQLVFAPPSGGEGEVNQLFRRSVVRGQQYGFGDQHNKSLGSPA